MATYYGDKISDSYINGYPNQAVLNITITSNEHITWQLTATGGSSSGNWVKDHGYGLTIGTSSGAGDIANVTTGRSGNNVFNGTTLTSGSAAIGGTIYFSFHAYLFAGDDAHRSDGSGSMVISTPASPTPPAPAVPTLPNYVTIECFGLESGTTNTLFATWSFSKEHTKEYDYTWESYIPGTVANTGFWAKETGTTTEKVSTFTPASNATMARFTVTPVSETYKLNNDSSTEVSYWTGTASTYKTYDFTDNPPVMPSVPTVTIDKYTLSMEITNIDTSTETSTGIHADSIEFQIVKDDLTVFNTGLATIKMNRASYSCTVGAGSKYKVRARSAKLTLRSEWSNYSSNVQTIPAAPKGITTIRGNSATSVYLEWASVANATTYEIEYADKITYFDSSSETHKVSGIEFTHYEQTGLSAAEYFFRVRATNSAGSSAWTNIKSVTIGKAPAAPTTWSSTTTIVSGGTLTLYWIHNSRDGSSQTYAELELTINGTTNTYTIKNSTDPDQKDKTSYYIVDTASLVEGAKISWRVRTSGVTTVYGGWSVQRLIDVYAPATLALNILDIKSAAITTLTAFPFYIKGVAGPATQAPIGYHVSITSDSYYETTDEMGTKKVVNAGEEVYSKYFDTSDVLLLEMSASNIDLQNNVTYSIAVTVSMNSGLVTTRTASLAVSWTDGTYFPSAEIGIDPDIIAAYIRPYCYLSDATLAPGVTMGVYRREFDGSFTEIATGIPNEKLTFVTDPHPSLDLARYRIVATETSTGAISFFDTPGVPTNERGAILQWNEEWSNFDTTSGQTPTRPAWTGSMLRLLYNVDVKDDNSIDVSTVEYIGRKHPVSYYGTQINSTSSWSMDVPKSDKDTIYQLRRLAIWPGDVYVREPSGTGYWANVKVSFDLTHCEMLVPVSLDITRVEGGI